MRHIHIISIDDLTVCNLAVSLVQMGFNVTASYSSLPTHATSVLQEANLLPECSGFDAAHIDKNIEVVVPTMSVTEENVELQKAKELGLQIMSFPQFIYWLTKDKVRVVVSGSQGKNSILSMMLYALGKHKIAADYVALDPIKGYSSNIKLGTDGRIALLVSNEFPASHIEKRPFHHFYRPHIVVLPTLRWEESEEYPTEESFLNSFKILTERVERDGKCIYHEGEPLLDELATELREDITAIPFQRDLIIEGDGKIYLKNRFGLFDINIKDEFFLQNLSAARLACRQLGLQDKDFYAAISEYSFL
ncbi:MAG: Mur ligase family protein [Bacteroidales bacterium]